MFTKIKETWAAFQKLFSNDLEIDPQVERIKELEAEVQRLKEDLERDERSVRYWVNKDTERLREIAGYKQQIAAVKRAETEADLFFVSAKIMYELANGKRPADIKELLEDQRRFQEQLAMQQTINVHPFPAMGLSGLEAGPLYKLLRDVGL